MYIHPYSRYCFDCVNLTEYEIHTAKLTPSLRLATLGLLFRFAETDLSPRFRNAVAVTDVMVGFANNTFSVLKSHSTNM